ncbi:MAG: hypothetical protein LBP98_08965 [Tannerella sp.]|jgi:hypothetical protein|nr:hypothetical protein [Tannerella sp.]
MKQPAKTTPQEILSARKALLQEQCRTGEQKLNEDFAYLRDNAGSLLLSGLSWLITPGTGTSKRANVTPAKTGVASPASSVFSWSGILSTTKTLGPIVWEIAQPMLVSWGINKLKQWFFKPKKQLKSLND